MIKKKIVSDDYEIFVQFDEIKGSVIIGGAQHLADKLYSCYLTKFGECDGDPQFYSVIPNKKRLKFNCSMKRYNKAMLKFKAARFNIYDIKTFDRGM